MAEEVSSRTAPHRSRTERGDRNLSASWALSLSLTRAPYKSSPQVNPTTPNSEHYLISEGFLSRQLKTTSRPFKLLHPPPAFTRRCASRPASERPPLLLLLLLSLAPFRQRTSLPLLPRSAAPLKRSHVHHPQHQQQRDDARAPHGKEPLQQAGRRIRIGRPGRSDPQRSEMRSSFRLADRRTAAAAAAGRGRLRRSHRRRAPKEEEEAAARRGALFAFPSRPSPLQVRHDNRLASLMDRESRSPRGRKARGNRACARRRTHRPRSPRSLSSTAATPRRNSRSLGRPPRPPTRPSPANVFQ